MADNITTLRPTLRVPGAPRMPDAKPLTGAGRGTAALAEGVSGLAQGEAAVGRGFQRLGDAAFDAAITFERARQTEAVNKATNAAHDKLIELSTELDQDTDFLTAEETFETRSAAIRSEVEGELQTGNERREFGAKFDALSTVRKQRVHEGVFQRQGDQARATLAGSLDRLTREAVAAKSYEEIEAVGVLADTAIDGVAEDGFISRSEAVQKSQQFIANAAELQFEDMILRDPQRALSMLESDTPLPALRPDTRLRLRTRARTVAHQLREQMLAEQGATATDVRAAIGELRTISDAGLPPDETTVTAARAKADALGDPALKQRLAAIEATSALQRELMVMTPRDAAGRLDQMEGAVKDGATGPEAQMLLTARRTVGRMTAELKADPIAFAMRVGVLPPAPIDLSASELAPAFARRKGEAARIADRYQVRPRFFSLAERDAIAVRLKTGDADQRADTIGQVVRGFGTNAPEALAELGEKAPAAERLGTLKLLGGESGIHNDTVRTGFRGLKLIEDKLAKAPTASEAASILREEIGDAIDGRLIGLRRKVVETAGAIYAARATERNADEFDKDIYRGAVREALGQHSADGEAHGGVGSYNGWRMLLPQQMSEREFARAVDRLSPRDLADLSLSGAAPVYEDHRGKQWPFDPKKLSTVYFISVGEGVYQISTSNPAEKPPAYLVDEGTKAPYQIDLNQAPVPRAALPRFN